MKIKIWDDFKQPILKKKIANNNDLDEALDEIRLSLKKKFG